MNEMKRDKELLTYNDIYTEDINYQQNISSYSVESNLQDKKLKSIFLFIYGKKVA